jgi:hypothetical protein
MWLRASGENLTSRTARHDESEPQKLNGKSCVTKCDDSFKMFVSFATILSFYANSFAMDAGYKLVADGRSGFVRLHWEPLGNDFTDPGGATSPFAGLVDFHAHLETTYDYMNLGREHDFEDCLEALCRHFAAAAPNQTAFAM